VGHWYVRWVNFLPRDDYPVGQQRNSLSKGESNWHARQAASNAAASTCLRQKGGEKEFGMRFSTSFVRPFAIALAAALALSCGASTASAANIHFIGKVKAAVVGNEVVVSGKVSGIGNEEITYAIEIDAQLTVYLVNPGAKGNKPPGQNKEPLKAFGEGVHGVSEDNGQFTFTIRVDLTEAIAEALAGTQVKNNWTVEQGPLMVTGVKLTITQGNDTIQATVP
jgi:hypothetical protein